MPFSLLGALRAVGWPPRPAAPALRLVLQKSVRSRWRWLLYGPQPDDGTWKVIAMSGRSYATRAEAEAAAAVVQHSPWSAPLDS